MPTAEWRRKNADKARAYRKAYYERNRQQEIDRSKRRNAMVDKDIRLFLRKYKTDRGCSRCCEVHPACLDLHHVDATKKTINPSRIAAQRWSFARIHAELENCEVLCANCHRKEHFIG